MKILIFKALTSSLVACAAASPSPAPPAAPGPIAAVVTAPSKPLDRLDEGRAVAAAFGRREDLWARFAPPMKQLFGDEPAKYRAFVANAANDLGVERE